jgi:protein TonB
MRDIVQSNFWLTDKSEGRRFAIALAAGLALELGVLAAALPWLTHQRAPAQTQSQVVKLAIIAPAPAPPAPPPPKPLPKVLPPPKPVMPPPPVPPPPPLPVAPPLPPPPIPMRPAHFVHHLEHIRHVQPPPPKVTPPPVQEAPPTPTPPPAPPVIPQPSAGEIDLFQAQMAQAVQRAANADYPPAAQMARENGNAYVDFTFTDGAVSKVTIVQSSGFPLLDEAALQAVRDAAYPQEPPDFAGHSHSVRVIVRFHTAAVNTDGD